jgi:tetratricopeptide (TPR) repeat protein
MKLRTLALTALFAGFAAPAGAAVMAIGSTNAHLCFEAAESSVVPSFDDLDRCNQALSEEGLSLSDTAATHVNRGVLLLRRGNLDAAIADFDRALSVDPEQPEAYLNKGMATLKKSGWQQAMPLFDTALQKHTRKPEYAYYGRAIAHELAGDAKSAYLDYRQASVLAPNWAQPAKELTRFHVERR